MTGEPDLPRWGIVIEAWRVLIDNTGAALRIAVLPFLILVAMYRLLAMAAPSGLEAIGLQFLFVIAFPVPAALLLVPWYRLIVSARRPELAGRPATWWYVAFMVRTLGLELMLFVFQLPILIASIMVPQDIETLEPRLALLMWMLFLLVAPGFYLYGRAALSLPAAAGAGDDSYGRSWQVTAGAGWRIGGIVAIPWIIFLLISWLLSGIPAGIPASVVGAAIDVIRELTMAAALALVYLHYDRTPVADVFS